MDECVLFTAGGQQRASPPVTAFRGTRQFAFDDGSGREVQPIMMSCNGMRAGAPAVDWCRRTDLPSPAGPP
ncbi:hypothetical protein A4R44_02973 [Amycolatopsis sp. M39]|uniref:Uncharacterized protein n=1 Tax=Amycolatopsis rubida TaxID=112413 RepID=A0A1I5URS3_9PSEU|nr:hypothetical protein A4R44_02973 [Amycolatopsis sp. M39]SFP97737.1 hypothetical protein SAMN05421854_10862 [Amycolatopsis rubida]